MARPVSDAIRGGAAGPVRGTDSTVRMPLVEVFASIQGEGAYAGEPQVFVRTAGCPLRCRYCDTPDSWAVPAQRPDDGGWSSPFQVACAIAEAEARAAAEADVVPAAPRTVSLTGGEPCLWPDAALELKPLLGRRRLHLETSGGFPAALARMVDACDHVSLDLKLACDMRAPVADVGASLELPESAEQWAAARRASLELVRGRDAASKLVLTGASDLGEAARALEEVAEHAPECPVFLQPATPFAGAQAPSVALVAELREYALSLELTVRVLPQLHPLFGWR